MVQFGEMSGRKNSRQVEENSSIGSGQHLGIWGLYILIENRNHELEPQAGEWFHCKVLNILWLHLYSL